MTKPECEMLSCFFASQVLGKTTELNTASSRKRAKQQESKFPLPSLRFENRLRVSSKIYQCSFDYSSKCFNFCPQQTKIFRAGAMAVKRTKN